MKRVLVFKSFLSWNNWDVDGDLIIYLRDFFSNLHELSWELLDNAAYSNLCDCCDSSCKSRWTRSTVSGICTTSAVLNSTHCIALKLFVFSPKTGKHGMVQKAVLGPLTITDWNSWKASVKLYYISILSQQQPHLFFLFFSPTGIDTSHGQVP